MPKRTFDTVVETLQNLKSRGFTIDFNIDAEKLICRDKVHCLGADEFEITEVHRFEGNTDPSDENVIYAVESKDGKLKGVIFSAFGMYADPVSNKLVRKLSMHRS